MIDAPAGRFYQFCNNLQIGEEMKSIPIDLASALRHGEKNTQVIKDKTESLRAKLATDNLVSHAERRADARVATRINAVEIIIGASSLICCPDFNHGDSAFN
jgi:hypothetical protein